MPLLFLLIYAQLNGQIEKDIENQERTYPDFF